MEDRFSTSSGTGSTWDRSRKKLNIKRESVPLEDSPSLLIFNIPAELTLHIISLLNVFDVISLSFCSKFFNQLCKSDCVWEKLYVKRWPNHSEAGSQSSCSQNGQGWKDSYITKHKATAAIFSDHFRGSFEELDVYPYLDAVDVLTDLKAGFEDVCLLFRTELSVMLNLIGLHYAYIFLGVSPKDLMDALVRHRLCHRQVIVHWCFRDNINDWSTTRIPCPTYTLKLSLAEIANGEQAIFYLLDHGTSSEIRTLTICPAK